MDTYDYLVIGGGLAAARTCQGIRGVDKEGSMALVSAESHLPYERPPLSKGFLRGTEGLDHVYVRDAAYYESNGIALVLGVPGAAIDRSAKSVTLADGRALGYGKLMLATGGAAWRLRLPGSDLAGVYTLRTVDDSRAVRESSKSGARALVIGGSFIGSEVAASLSQMGVHVTMVFLESRLLERVLPKELSSHLRGRYEAEGIRLLPQTKPARIEGEGAVERVVLDSGETLAVELVVMGVGIVLNTDLAREAGLEMTEKGAVVVDRFLATSDPSIYAAGDIAAWPDRTFKTRLRVEHWDVARSQGFRAGRNMAGDVGPFATLPYFFSDLFEISIDVWGNVASWDQTVRRGTIESGSYAYYYFSQGQMVGVLAKGRPDSEREPMQAMVKARPQYADVASKIPDERVDLAELA